MEQVTLKEGVRQEGRGEGGREDGREVLDG